MSEISGMYQNQQVGKRRKKWLEDKIQETKDIINLLEDDLFYYKELLERI